MCPSYHAFKDERHTTRARAQSLRSILNGRIPLKELTEKGLLDVLDYCLECKGCATECPSQVDMAKMKMEVLYQYQQKHGYFLKSHLFGRYGKLAHFASLFPSLANWLFKTSQPLFPLLGLTAKRPLPQFAPERFSSWWKQRTQVKGRKKIRLFIDTFTEFNCPEVGRAAVQLLEKIGYQVEPIQHLCCGRTYLSMGMLKPAKEKAVALTTYLQNLREPVVVLEPSCLSTLSHDYAAFDLPTFNVRRIEEMLPPTTHAATLFYHPHCHEQALASTFPLQQIFPRIIKSEAGCLALPALLATLTNIIPCRWPSAKPPFFPKLMPLLTSPSSLPVFPAASRSPTALCEKPSTLQKLF